MKQFGATRKVLNAIEARNLLKICPSQKQADEAYAKWDKLTQRQKAIILNDALTQMMREEWANMCLDSKYHIPWTQEPFGFAKNGVEGLHKVLWAAFRQVREHCTFPKTEEQRQEDMKTSIRIQERRKERTPF